MEDAMANTILKELREFRTENNKRWEENDKRWEENDKRWQENNEKWNENQQLWKANTIRWEENTKTLAGMNKRITALEEGRKKDRIDLLEILDTMQKTINDQFIEMREYFDAKFDKILVSQRVNDIEHEEFKKLACAHETRLNFYNSRISHLEAWKEQFDMGEFTAV